MKMILITTNNEVEQVELKDYEEIKNKIGGYIEIVMPVGLPDYCLIIDDEGLLKNLPVNFCGSMWYGFCKHGQLIVGDILISKPNLCGDLESLTEFDCEKINLILKDFGMSWR
jgi:hypothetical protein